LLHAYAQKKLRVQAKLLFQKVGVAHEANVAVAAAIHIMLS